MEPPTVLEKEEQEEKDEEGEENEELDEEEEVEDMRDSLATGVLFVMASEARARQEDDFRQQPLLSVDVDPHHHHKAAISSLQVGGD